MPQAAYVLYKRPNSVKKNPGDFVTQEKEQGFLKDLPQLQKLNGPFSPQVSTTIVVAKYNNWLLNASSGHEQCVVASNEWLRGRLVAGFFECWYMYLC